MNKIDLKKELKDLYSMSIKGAVIIDVPEFSYLMVDGKGDPNTSVDYKNAIEGLYSVAYGLKFNVRKEQDVDYGVMPLEGLWWIDDMTKFSMENKDEWHWTAMIMQPKFITKELFIKTQEQTAKKKNLPALYKIRLNKFTEGLTAQVLHIGSYSAEKPTIEKLHSFITDNGYQLSGKHHEIYFGDPRRSATDKLKTLIRQPMKK